MRRFRIFVIYFYDNVDHDRVDSLISCYVDFDLLQIRQIHIRCTRTLSATEPKPTEPRNRRLHDDDKVHRSSHCERERREEERCERNEKEEDRQNEMEHDAQRSEFRESVVERDRHEKQCIARGGHSGSRTKRSQFN